MTQDIHLMQSTDSGVDVSRICNKLKWSLLPKASFFPFFICDLKYQVVVDKAEARCICIIVYHLCSVLRGVVHLKQSCVISALGYIQIGSRDCTPHHWLVFTTGLFFRTHWPKLAVLHCYVCVWHYTVHEAPHYLCEHPVRLVPRGTGAYLDYLLHMKVHVSRKIDSYCCYLCTYLATHLSCKVLSAKTSQYNGLGAHVCISQRACYSDMPIK